MIPIYHILRYNPLSHLFAHRVLSSATTPGRVDLVAMAMKGYSAFSKAPSDCIVSFLGYSLWGSYLPAETQSVYSIAPANWASRYQVKWIKYLAEIIKYQVKVIRYKVRDIKNIKYEARGNNYQVKGINYQLRDIKYPVKISNTRQEVTTTR